MLEAIGEASADAVVVVSSEHRIIYYNRKLREMWNIGGDVHGMSLEDGLRAAKMQLANPGECYELVMRARKRPDESHQGKMRLRTGRILDADVTPIRGDDGTVVASLWLLRDAIRSADAKSEIRNVGSHAPCILYETFVEAKPGWETDVDGERRLFTWSLTVPDEVAAQRVLPLDVPAGADYWSVWKSSRLAEDLPKMARTAAHAFINGHKSFAQDFRCVDKNGRIVWLREDVSIERLAPNRWRTFGVCTNVTEQKNAEEALRAVEERFSRFMANVPGVTFIKDADGRLVYMNAMHDAIAHGGPEEWRNKAAADLFPPETAAQIEANDARVRRTGEPFRGIETIPLKDGLHKYFASKFLLNPDEGARSLLGGIAIDVTEHRRAEDEVRFQRALLESVSETSMEGILVVSAEGQVLLCNKRFLELWQIPTDALPLPNCDVVLSHVCGQLVDPEEFQQRVAHFKLHPEEQGRLEIHLRDGRVFDRYTAPIRDGNGKLCGRVWFIRDVTERKQALQELENVAAHTRCILWHAEIVGEAGWERDLDYKRYPFQWNVRFHDEQAAQQVLALDVAEGKTYVHSFGRSRHPEDKRVGYQTTANAMLRGERSYSQDYRCYDKRGKLHWIHEDVSLEKSEHGRWKAFGVCTNITDRKQAEELRAELAAIVEWSDDAIIGARPDGIITSWNWGAERIFGYCASEIIGRSLETLRPENCAEQMAGILQAVAGGKAVQHFETERVRKDGARVQVSLALSPIKNHDGAVIGISEIARDISEHKRAERALHASESRFSLFMQHLPGLAFIKDANGRVTFINEAHKRTLGWTGDEWRGKTVRELFPPAIAAVMEDHDCEVLRTMKPAQAVEKIPQDDGEHSYIVSKFPIADPSGGNVVLGGICIDVTERTRAEELVRYQNTLLESLMETSRDGVLLADGEGKWLKFNRRFVQMWGIEEDVVRSRSDRQARQSVTMLLRNPEEFLRRIEYFYEHPHETGDDRIELRDGRVIERYTVPLAVGAGSLSYGRAWFFHDATEEVQMRESLRCLAWEISRSEERERRRIAAMLHDHVGQMLTVVRIRLGERVGKGSAADDPAVAEIPRLVDEIIAATRTLTAELSPPVLYECGLYAALRWLGSTMLEGHGIKFDIQIASEPQVDEEARLVLFRSVRELFLNVLKHAKAGNVETRVWQVDEHLFISVEDNGVGCDCQRTKTKAAEQNSFGLFLIREQLERVGGRFTMESGAEKGTRVTLKVPIDRKA